MKNRTLLYECTEHRGTRILTARACLHGGRHHRSMMLFCLNSPRNERFFLFFCFCFRFGISRVLCPLQADRGYQDPAQKTGFPEPANSECVPYSCGNSGEKLWCSGAPRSGLREVHGSGCQDSQGKRAAVTTTSVVVGEMGSMPLTI